MNKIVRYGLAHASLYHGVQKMLGSNALWSVLVDEHIQPKQEDRVLDIGCGTADILPFLPCQYVGFDPNEKYVRFAKEKFKGRGTFLIGDVGVTVKKFSDFNIVLALGVLHHLSDSQAKSLFEIANANLKSNGRLITVDPCFDDKQSKIARYIISRDRGRYVRSVQHYPLLASSVFKNVKVSVRHNLLRIPYTHIIMECA